MAETNEIEPGQEDGTGAVFRSRWTTALPYGFVFESEVIRVERPFLLELRSRGELEGTGLWRLSHEDGGTMVQYFWNVRTSKPWMRFLAPLLRPAFAWNHAMIMQAGGVGQARKLNVSVPRNESYTRESGSPWVPISAVAGVLSLLLFFARLLRVAGRR